MTKGHREGLIRPGNETYLSYYVDQRKWKPSMRIGTIGAMHGSPGPAIVYLPPTIGDDNHDPRKVRAPAYVIGEKDDRMSFSCGPGPAVYDIRKMTNKGKDECHAPIVGEKKEDHVHFRSPGPAAYHKGDSDSYAYPRMPAYTMRPKPDPLRIFTPPSPSTYTLPETLGPGRSPFKKSPSYRMGERLDKTGVYQPRPGPTDYQLPTPNVNKPKAPAYSMRIKEKENPYGPVSPGPASNYYHMVKFNKPATPRYTFGIRHTPFEAFQHFAAEK